MEKAELCLEKLPFWKNLTDDEKKLAQETSVVHFRPKGTVLQGCSGGCLGMICVLSGCIRASLLSEEGREITLFRIEKNETCVLSARCVLPQITFDTHMVTEEDSEILLLPSSAFNSLTENNIYVRCFTYELISERFSSVMWTMQQILFFKFDKRLATYLLSQYEKTGKKEITRSQEEIAVDVNSAREVVSRMLKRFSADGLITLNRKSILLDDIDGLKNI